MLACYSPADGADHAEECSKLHYFADKDRLFEVKAVFCFVVYCLGVVCDYLRDLRETLWFLLCELTESSCMLFSRRSRRSRIEECSKLHYHAEKDRLELVWFGVLLFC